MIPHTITKNNLHIPDSWIYSKHNFRDILKAIREEHPDSDVWERSDGSLCREWATHNLLYALGIARERTKDVDLNYPQKWYVRIGYGICGAIAIVFIK